jgi:inositol phosphorylceramide mannosyltransferase catalytic subunit
MLKNWLHRKLIMIPKIIHQTYKSHNLPKVFAECQKTICELHPDFEYRFYTDEDMYAEVQTNFPEYYDEFIKLPRMIMKIDMFRYFLMYRYGGLYADMDYMMFKPFDMLNEEIVIPCNREDNNVVTCLGNCVFASRPNHPFWKTVIDSLFTLDRKRLTKDSDVEAHIHGTGPMFLYHMWTGWVRLHPDTNEVNVPRRHLFHPPTDIQAIQKFRENKISYGMHMCTGEWRNRRL